MKIAHAELPKTTRQPTKTLDAKTLKAALAELEGSIDFAPYAYTDGKEYKRYTEALSEANLTIRDVSRQSGRPANMLARKVWSNDGQKDRKKDGKWQFAVSWRSAPPKPRAPRQATPQPIAA